MSTVTSTHCLPPSMALLLVVALFLSEALIVVEAFASPAEAIYAKNGISSVAQYTHLFSNKQNDDYNDNLPANTGEGSSTSSGREGVSRRGILWTLATSAAGFAVGDSVMNAAVKAVSAGGSGVAAMTTGVPVVRGVFERVMAFGRKNQAVVASEELLAWVASQRNVVGKYPELQAWIAAQRRLQVLQRAASTTASVATAAKTSRRAAAGVAMEEGILGSFANKVAASAAIGEFISRPDNSTTISEACNDVTKVQEESPPTLSSNDDTDSIGVDTNMNKEKNNGTV